VRKVCTCRDKFLYGTERKLLFVITFVKNISLLLPFLLFTVSFVEKEGRKEREGGEGEERERGRTVFL